MIMSPAAASQADRRARRMIRMKVAAGASAWPSSAKQRNRRLIGRRYLWLPTLFLLISILNNQTRPLLNLANCEPAQQQRGQLQSQQQSNEITGLTQDSSQFSSGDGMSLGEGLAALGTSYKRGPFTNAKRARKMSAFMPMRGRKDGRDLIGWDSLRDLQPPGGARYPAQSSAAANFGGGGPLSAGQQQRQPDSVGVSGADQSQFGLGGSNQQLFAQTIRESDPGDVSLVRLFNGRATMPRQFFNQLQMRTAASGESQTEEARRQQQLNGPVERSGGRQASDDADQVERHNTVSSSSASSSSPELVASGSLSGSGGNNNNNQIMQAKLRRAFHPMRGKKASLLPAALTPLQLEDLFTNLNQNQNSLTELDEF